jgi:hypothetical protein
MLEILVLMIVAVAGVAALLAGFVVVVLIFAGLLLGVVFLFFRAFFWVALVICGLWLAVHALRKLL